MASETQVTMRRDVSPVSSEPSQGEHVISALPRVPTLRRQVIEDGSERGYPRKGSLASAISEKAAAPYQNLLIMAMPLPEVAGAKLIFSEKGAKGW